MLCTNCRTKMVITQVPEYSCQRHSCTNCGRDLYVKNGVIIQVNRKGRKN